MHRLPSEIFCVIFKNLDLVSLIRMRRVCKAWKFLIDNIGLKELNLVKKRDENLREDYGRNKLFFNNLDQAIELVKKRFKIMNLKYLNIVGELDLNALVVNFFCELSKLEILKINIFRFQTCEAFNLPSLMTFQCITAHGLSTSIEQPKVTIIAKDLKNVSIQYGLRYFNFSDPLKIENLEIVKCEMELLWGFENLEQLTLFNSVLCIDFRFVLRFLPNLKFFYIIKEQGPFSQFVDPDKTVAMIDFLIEEKFSLNRLDLKIYFDKTLLGESNKKVFDTIDSVTFKKQFSWLESFSLCCWF